ncbi:hypothetical protein D5086_033195 [Populus alba]|uniref:Uncharacterized protein n=1 Tax=Populus alba TaxID=43335 RepID=A0ACC4AG43_POPAL
MKVSIIPALCNEHQSHQNFVDGEECGSGDGRMAPTDGSCTVVVVAVEVLKSYNHANYPFEEIPSNIQPRVRNV